MENKVIVAATFERKTKKFLKKFRTLASELEELEKQLLKDPKKGINLGDNLYKIRLASKSKGKGKSGGFRVITYLIEQTPAGCEINLITIYDKSEEANINKSTLLDLVKSLFG